MTIADWVRLNAGYVPPHWKREADGDWDGGYQKTAYFLDWIEARHGDGTIRLINDLMKDVPYTDEVFVAATGKDVDVLWSAYCAYLDRKGGTS